MKQIWLIENEGNLFKGSPILSKVWLQTMLVYLKSTLYGVCYVDYAVRENLTHGKWSEPVRLELPMEKTNMVVIEEDEIPFFELFFL